MTPEDLRARVAGHAQMVALLRAVAADGPPGAWIGAGFLRNAAWDWLHGRDAAPEAADLDVVFHAPGLDEAPFAGALASAVPVARWEVVNQARLSRANDLRGALAEWPETATAIAARWQGGVELMAAHGWDDLLGLRLRPTPAFVERRCVVEQRAAAKGWLTRWPLLGWA